MALYFWVLQILAEHNDSRSLCQRLLTLWWTGSRKKGPGTGYFITEMAPYPLTLDPTSYYIMPSDILPSRSHSTNQASSSQDPSTFPNLTSWQNASLVQEMAWGHHRQNRNGRALTLSQVDTWICLCERGKPPSAPEKADFGSQ